MVQFVVNARKDKRQMGPPQWSRQLNRRKIKEDESRDRFYAPSICFNQAIELKPREPDQ